MEDDLRTRVRHIAFLVCVNNPLVLTGGVKFGQSEGIPDSGIPERLPLRKFHRRSLVVFPSLPSFFPTLSFALFFAHAPLSERLEQAIFCQFEKEKCTMRTFFARLNATAFIKFLAFPMQRLFQNHISKITDNNYGKSFVKQKHV